MVLLSFAVFIALLSRKYCNFGIPQYSITWLRNTHNLADLSRRGKWLYTVFGRISSLLASSVVSTSSNEFQWVVHSIRCILTLESFQDFNCVCSTYENSVCLTEDGQMPISIVAPYSACEDIYVWHVNLPLIRTAQTFGNAAQEEGIDTSDGFI